MNLFRKGIVVGVFLALGFLLTTSQAFAISATSTEQFKLLTPNGGEQWMLNSELTSIAWTPDPHSDDVEAYLETKTKKGTFTTVGKVIKAGKGSIQWLGEIDSINNYAKPGSGYYIRIVNTKTGQTDRSDAPFTILPVTAMAVTLNLGDKDNNLYIAKSQNVKLSWSTKGNPKVCTLYTYDKNGNDVSTKSVPVNGSATIFADIPSPDFNGGLYTLATVSCGGPLGSRSDYVNIIATTAEISFGPINGDMYHGQTVEVGQKAPVINWSSNAGIMYRTYLSVNDTKKCNGIKNGQAWSQGKTKKGSFDLGIASEKMIGCELTFNYEVAQGWDRITDKATLTYVAKGTISKPEISITNKDGYSDVRVGDVVDYVWSAKNISVPSDILVYLYSPEFGYVIEESIGNVGKSNSDGGGGLRIERDFVPGQYRLSICDQKTDSFVTPGKPLCFNDQYFNVIGTSVSDPIITTVSTSASVREIDGFGEEGLFKAVLDVEAVGDDLLIDNKITTDLNNWSSGFGVSLSYGNRDIHVTDGILTGVISSNAEMEGNKYLVRKGQVQRFNLDLVFRPKTSDFYVLEMGGLEYSYRNSPNFRVQHGLRTDVIRLSTMVIREAMITPTIVKGASGEKVTLVQQALKQAGYFTEEVTGYFGDITKNAVAAFQKANALDNVGAVGAVGPKTAGLLNKLLGL